MLSVLIELVDDDIQSSAPVPFISILQGFKV